MKMIRVIGHWKRGKRPDVVSLKGLIDLLEYGDQLRLVFGRETSIETAAALQMLEARGVLSLALDDEAKVAAILKRNAWPSGKTIICARAKLSGSMIDRRLARHKLVFWLSAYMLELCVFREVGA